MKALLNLFVESAANDQQTIKGHTVNETTWALSTEQRLLNKAGGAKNQRHVANN